MLGVGRAVKRETWSHDIRSVCSGCAHCTKRFGDQRGCKESAMTWGEDTIPSVVMTAICGRGLRKGPVAWKHPQAREFFWALLSPHRSGAALISYGQELQPMFLT
jgi:hypothetical protein